MNAPDFKAIVAEHAAAQRAMADAHDALKRGMRAWVQAYVSYVKAKGAVHTTGEALVKQALPGIRAYYSTPSDGGLERRSAWWLKEATGSEAYHLETALNTEADEYVGRHIAHAWAEIQGGGDLSSTNVPREKDE